MFRIRGKPLENLGMPVGKDGICLEYVENHCETWKYQLEMMEYVWNTWKTTVKLGNASWERWNMFGIHGIPL
ncbi:MAG: hypothetical protein GX796_05185 [Clostridiaceae bacterium]|nr:hypothetical protein [Clostridiaceae bacterium]